MKKKQTGCLILWAMLLLLCTACRQSAVIYDSSKEPAATSQAVEGVQEVQEEQSEAFVSVYVCGEVKEPGVYELPAKARLTDAIEAAGGMTEEAADTYLNLAEYVTDGQKIEVPSLQKAEEWKEEERRQLNGLVNLNQASEEQLMTLTGIGEAKAKDILRYREQHGEFSRVEELMEIPGIKAGVFQKIKDQITV